MARPSKLASPDKMAQLSVVISAEVKNDAVRMSKETGRSLSREVELRLRSYQEQQNHLGGSRVMHLLQSLADAAKALYPNDDSWLDREEDFAVVVDDWLRVLQNIVPIDAVAETRYGYEMGAQAATLPPRLRYRVAYMLRNKSRLLRLPPQVRADFARMAAELTEVPPPTDDEVREAAEALSLPPNKARSILTDLYRVVPDFDADLDAAKETILQAAQPFMQAWMMARTALTARLRREPDDKAIAEYFGDSPELAVVAGFHVRRSAKDILRHHGDLLRMLREVAAPSLPDDGGDEAEP
jgi:hypothetical protein